MLFAINYTINLDNGTQANMLQIVVAKSMKNTNTDDIKNEDLKEKEKPIVKEKSNANVDDHENAWMMDEIEGYFKNKNKKRINNEPIESTMRFKYIRSLEALFESTPQAVVQLVYLMRTGDSSDIVIMISALQSILSMTNSMLSSDNAYMARPKFKKYRKRLPPSSQFLKHGLVRLSEISYRVGLFSIFWTVVGGQWFCILLSYELLFPIILNLMTLFYSTVEWAEFFLSLNLVCCVLL